MSQKRKEKKKKKPVTPSAFVTSTSTSTQDVDNVGPCAFADQIQKNLANISIQATVPSILEEVEVPEAQPRQVPMALVAFPSVSNQGTD